jgi:hypothetical protein
MTRSHPSLSRPPVEGRRDLWHTVIQERPITPDWVEAALAPLKF